MRRCSFTVPGINEVMIVNYRSRFAFLPTLASLWGDNGDVRIPLPGIKQLQTVIVAFPSSPRLPALLSEIKKRKWSAALLFKQPQELVREKRKISPLGGNYLSLA
ncbi:MAG: hypothetical protein DRP87_16410, partial [Spirochaetes bacterium]